MNLKLKNKKTMVKAENKTKGGVSEKIKLISEDLSKML